MFGMTDDQKLLMKIKPHAYFIMMRVGQGTYEGWNMIAVRLNTGQYAANKHFEPGPQEVVTEGLKALGEVHVRFLTQDRVGVSGDQMRAIGDALCMCDDLQDACKRREWLDVIDRVYTIAGVLYSPTKPH